uniref:Uncharacterized protein AlNc14C2G301 n=1 Tax=Albugo laibachii Nc14 TaxID=890382 RepID=F0VZG3_9STRA|nr:conserved hypothetical protein [Albugo laibachii Nc14]|eukprot:CCA14193.1 conserved hypothetical protein [Albugo laibachii Nc14]
MRIGIGGIDGNAAVMDLSHSPDLKQRTHSHDKSPGFDIRSPDRIGERLDNLKRRPSLLDWLNEYVAQECSSENDSDDDETSTKNLSTLREDCESHGWIVHTFWSLVTLPLLPVLLLMRACCSKCKLPMCHSSLLSLLYSSSAQILFLSLAITLIQQSITGQTIAPKISYSGWEPLYHRLKTDFQSLKCNVWTCLHQALAWNRSVPIQELWFSLFDKLECVQSLIRILAITSAFYLFFSCHKRWARMIIGIICIGSVMDAPKALQRLMLPSPRITGTDPAYALLGEELFVALNGRNLESGATVSWVPYWGCAHTTSVDECEKQHSSMFHTGVVTVRFDSADLYIPCYQSPVVMKDTEAESQVTCFENVKLRVKKIHSIPGWSKLNQTLRLKRQESEREADRVENEQDQNNMPVKTAENEL